MPLVSGCNSGSGVPFVAGTIIGGATGLGNAAADAKKYQTAIDANVAYIKQITDNKGLSAIEKDLLITKSLTNLAIELEVATPADNPNIVGLAQVMLETYHWGKEFGKESWPDLGMTGAAGIAIWFLNNLRKKKKEPPTNNTS